MDFGPAMQGSIYSISLIDRQHKTALGEHLKLLSTQTSMEFMSLLYRKVLLVLVLFSICSSCSNLSSIIGYPILNVRFYEESTLNLMV